MKEVKIIKYIENKRMTKANTMQIIRVINANIFELVLLKIYGMI